MTYHDHLACAMLSIGGGQVQQVGPVRGQQGVGPKVRAEAARGQNHGAKLLKAVAGPWKTRRIYHLLLL